MARFGLRKIVDLFKRSKQKDQSHERLFPDVSSHPVAKATPRSSTVITELIRRILAKPAETVLCTHTVTVTARAPTPSEIVEAEPQTTRPFHNDPEFIDSAASEDVELYEIAPSSDIIAPTTSDSSTQTSPELLIESNSGESLGQHEPLGPCEELPSPTTRLSTTGTTHSNEDHSCSEDRASVPNEDGDNPWTNRPRSLHSIELSTILDPGRLSEVQEVGHHFNSDDLNPPGDSMSQSSDDDDEEEELVDPDELRADWVPIMAIPKHLFKLALMEHLPEQDGVTAEDICCIGEIKGGFNFVRILEIDAGSCAGRYIIKVPCTGTASRWQESDAYMLRNDARTMAYISEKTDIPSPKVLGYSDSLSNALTAPYVIMGANEGVPSNQIWFEDDGEGCDNLQNAYKPSAERMAIRINFLRSLAFQMAKLQTLEFDAAGTLNFDDDEERPVVGPTYHWKNASDLVNLSIPELATPASINCIPLFSTSDAYFMTALNTHWPKEDAPKTHIRNGRHHIMQRILACPPFCSSKKANDDAHETFVLRHDDLDFQNILCDAAGNVTAIIDWDKVRTAPRCLGFAALPAFLTKDWAPNFTSFADVHMPWELDAYRNVYARAMLEAAEDGKYTMKSAIYQAVDAALYGGHNGGSIPSMVRKVLKELESTRQLEDADVLTALGEGWEQGVGRVDWEIEGLVKPKAELDVVEPGLFGEM